MKNFGTFRILIGATSLRVLVLMFSLVTNIVLSRALGVADRGYYQVVIVVASLMMSLGSLSIELSLSQLWSRTKNEEHQQKRLASTALVGCLSLGVVSGTSVVVLAYLVPWLNQELTGGMAILLGLTTVLMLVRAGTQRVLFLTNRALWAAGSTVIESIFVLGLLVVSSYSDIIDVQLAVSYFVAGMCLSSLIGLWKTREFLVWPEFRTFWELLRNGIRFHPGQLAIVLLVRLDIVILGILSTPDQAGLYAVAIAITGPLDILGLAITTTFLNKIFTGSNLNAALQTQKLVRLSLAVIPTIATGAAILVPIVVPALWGEDFRGAVAIVWILLPGACALSIQRPLGQFMVRMGLSKSMNLRATAALFMNVVLNFWLIPIWGGIGAAVACSFSYILYAWLSIVFFSRYTETPLAEVIRGMIPTLSDVRGIRRSFK